MTQYSVLARVRQPGFKVEIHGADGTKSTMLGFTTEEEANVWVAESRRRDALHINHSGD